MDNMIKIETVKNKLSEKNIKISWAAKELNLSYPHFHLVINGKRPLSYKTSKLLDGLMKRLADQEAG